MTETGSPDWESLGQLAAAAAGDREALGRIAASEQACERAAVLGLGPVLAVVAGQAKEAAPESWSRALRLSISTWLLVEEAARLIARILGDAGVDWAPPLSKAPIDKYEAPSNKRVAPIERARR